jgi:hypothetical protein
MRASDGTTVDASVIPERGAPARVAMLSGFTEGWYELIHANGRADRVTWDADKLPFGQFSDCSAPFDASELRFYVEDMSVTLSSRRGGRMI